MCDLFGYLGDEPPPKSERVKHHPQQVIVMKGKSNMQWVSEKPINTSLYPYGSFCGMLPTAKEPSLTQVESNTELWVEA